MNKRRPTLAITTGEPAGIGPEIAIRAAWALREQANCVLLGDAAFLAMTAADIDPGIGLSALSLQALRHSGLPDFGAARLAVVDVPLAAHVVPGLLDAANGRAVANVYGPAPVSMKFVAPVTAPPEIVTFESVLGVSVRS